METINHQFVDDSPISDDEEKCVKYEELGTVKDFYKKNRKQSLIIRALQTDDFVSLQAAAIGKWGLVNDELRRKAWPRLLGITVYDTSPKPTQKDIENHHYYNQVVMDVNRSLKRFPPSIEEKQRLAMQDQLVALIMRILVKHPDLHYYQGYHDICVTFLLVLGEEVSFIVLEKLSTESVIMTTAIGKKSVGGHLRVFMDETMDRTTEILGYIYVLVKKEDPVLREFLEKSDVGVMFGLSWLITWFGHVLNKYDEVVRLFDLFLATHSWMPVYLTTSIVLYRKEEIFRQECEMAAIHCLLSQFPNDLPMENLVTEALHLFHNCPPEELMKEENEVKQLKCIADMAERKKRSFNSIRHAKGVVGSMVKIYNTFRTVLPDSNWTMSVVIAMAVFVCAAFYKTYQG